MPLSMQSVKADVLKYLFVNYKESPGKIVDITDFVSKIRILIN